ncbi:Uncharacterised protein [Chlamydia trachomatis]|nr:Uncharacterised protein [Chlamydia trachomatis]
MVLLSALVLSVAEVLFVTLLSTAAALSTFDPDSVLVASALPSVFTTVCSVGLVCSGCSFLDSSFLLVSVAVFLEASAPSAFFLLAITLCSFAGSFVLTGAEAGVSAAIAGVAPKAIAAPAITPAAPAERAATLRISTAFADLSFAEPNVLLACLADFVVMFLFFLLEQIVKKF